MSIEVTHKQKTRFETPEQVLDYFKTLRDISKVTILEVHTNVDIPEVIETVLNGNGDE